MLKKNEFTACGAPVPPPASAFGGAAPPPLPTLCDQAHDLRVPPPRRLVGSAAARGGAAPEGGAVPNYGMAVGLSVLPPRRLAVSAAVLPRPDDAPTVLSWARLY
jgi:hypothetical protein